jgi:hypothetical protein
MRAKIVNENMRFERGADPKSSIGIGVASILNNFSKRIGFDWRKEDEFPPFFYYFVRHPQAPKNAIEYLLSDPEKYSILKNMTLDDIGALSIYEYWADVLVSLIKKTPEIEDSFITDILRRIDPKYFHGETSKNKSIIIEYFYKKYVNRDEG